MRWAGSGVVTHRLFIGWLLSLEHLTRYEMNVLIFFYEINPVKTINLFIYLERHIFVLFIEERIGKIELIFFVYIIYPK